MRPVYDILLRRVRQSDETSGGGGGGGAAGEFKDIQINDGNGNFFADHTAKVYNGNMSLQNNDGTESLGIGTTTPSGFLDVENSNKETNHGTSFVIQDNLLNFSTYDENGNTIYFQVAPTGLYSNGGSGPVFAIVPQGKFIGIKNNSPTHTLELGTTEDFATFFQTIGQDGNDFVIYSYPLDEYLFRIDGDNSHILFNEGSVPTVFTGIGLSNPEYPLHIKQTGVNTGYGLAHLAIEGSDSEVGIVLDNTGTNGKIVNIFSSNDNSGIGRSKFALTNVSDAYTFFAADLRSNKIVIGQNNNNNSLLTIDNDGKLLTWESNDPWFSLNGDTRRFQIGDFTSDWYGTFIDINDDNTIKQVGLNASGGVRINRAYTLPLTDGTNHQVITTDGAGNLGFSDMPAGVLESISHTNQTSNVYGGLYTNTDVSPNMYKVYIYAEPNTLAIAGTVLVTIQWQSNSYTKEYSTIAMSLTDMTNSLSFVLPIMLDSGGDISYSTTVVGLVGGSYNINIKLEKV